MTLTVVVGASGSGKTTFLNDVHAMHKCTYIRQYHNLRPYVLVSKIPNFDPAKLPFWEQYADQPDIRVGGTMAGEFTAGFSGGQRKLLLFELVRQRTEGSEGLLLIFDEPFAGVTEDFVPYITEQLKRINHSLAPKHSTHSEYDQAISQTEDELMRVDKNSEHILHDLTQKSVELLAQGRQVQQMHEQRARRLAQQHRLAKREHVLRHGGVAVEEGGAALEVRRRLVEVELAQERGVDEVRRLGRERDVERHVVRGAERRGVAGRWGAGPASSRPLRGGGPRRGGATAPRRRDRYATSDRSTASPRPLRGVVATAPRRRRDRPAASLRPPRGVVATPR